MNTEILKVIGSGAWILITYAHNPEEYKYLTSNITYLAPSSGGWKIYHILHYMNMQYMMKILIK